MELLFVSLFGVTIGAVVRFVVPGRNAIGGLLLPSVGGAVTAGVWAVLTWAGLPFDGGWIWIVSLLAATIAAILTARILPRRRERADAELLSTLQHA